MKQRIAVDMDDVLVNTAQGVVDLYEKHFGYQITEQDLAGKLAEHAVPNPEHTPIVLDWIFAKGFFRNLPVMPDAKEVMPLLCEKYDVYIVSAANQMPHSLAEKLEWLQEHLPFISWRNTVMCGYKGIIKADLMIDDHTHNIDAFDGKGYLFNAHHNVFKDNAHYDRVMGWKDVARRLL